MLRVVTSLVVIACATYYLPVAESSVCPIFTALIGPCVSFMCPENATCICGCCCQRIMLTTRLSRGLRLGAARTGSGSNCRDRLPDCPQKRHLCNNAQFYDMMAEKCPKTCDRCPKASKQPGKEDTETVEDQEEERKDTYTSIAEWYGNNRGGYGSYGSYGNGGYGSGYGSNYGNYYG
uniref:ShKT domain-containing protein n=1 Tax=Plectus sambesii TaxID=2011161 RepID=A0A914WPN6_9BILA